MTLFDLDQPEPAGKQISGVVSNQGGEVPLAARMRPRNFSEFVGQEALVGAGRVLRKCVESDRLPSLIFWGPPGSGKTTLAFIIASVTSSHFTSISAVSAGVADLRNAIGDGSYSDFKKEFYRYRSP